MLTRGCWKCWLSWARLNIYGDWYFNFTMLVSWSSWTNWDIDPVVVLVAGVRVSWSLCVPSVCPVSSTSVNHSIGPHALHFHNNNQPAHNALQLVNNTSSFLSSTNVQFAMCSRLYWYLIPKYLWLLNCRITNYLVFCGWI